MTDDTTIKLIINDVRKGTGLKSATKEVEALGNTVKKTSAETSKSGKSIMKTLTDLGSQFRYLSLVAGLASGAMLKTLKSTTSNAMAMEQSMLNVQITARRLGYDVKEVTATMNELVATGFFSIEKAATSLSKLMSTGLNLDLITKALWGMSDIAAVARKGQYALDDAVSTASEGIVSQRDIQWEAIGMYENMSQAVRRLAESEGKQVAKLTIQEKQYYALVAILERAQIYQGAFQLSTETNTGAINSMQSSIKLLSAEVGNVLLPVLSSAALLVASSRDELIEWVRTHQSLIRTILLGGTALVIFVSALAGLGALVPLVMSGLGALSKILWAVLPGSIMQTLKGLTALKASLAAVNLQVVAINAVFIALIALLAAIIWETRFFQNVFSRTMGLISDRMDKVKSSLADMTQMTGEAADAQQEYSSEQLKQLDKLTKSRQDENDRYQEQLMETAKAHAETIASLETDLDKLNRSEEKWLQERKDRRDEDIADLEKTYGRRISDLEEDLREERSLGIRADQERLADIEKRLRREKEDMAADLADKAQNYADDVEEHKASTDEKRTEIETQLTEEYKLRKKHRDIYANWREYDFKDEFEKITARHDAIVSNLDEELLKLEENKGAVTDFTTALANMELPDMSTDLDLLINEFSGAGFEAGQSFGTEFNNILSEELDRSIDLIHEAFSPENLKAATKQVSIGIGDWIIDQSALLRTIRDLKKGDYDWGWTNTWPQFQEGGVVEGRTGSAIPVIAHEGETILPKGVSPTNISININNPMVRNDNDIQAIGDAVEKVIARKIKLRQLGAG